MSELPQSERYWVYAGVAEMSIYVAGLLSALIAEAKRQGIWTLQAGIFPENAASIQLHKRFGFRVVGTRERIGFMDGRWRDVTLMERREP